MPLHPWLAQLASGPIFLLPRRAIGVALRAIRWAAKRFRQRWQPYLRAARRPRFVPDQSSDVVVALTSFPARIGAVWAVVDTLLLQDTQIKAIVLVLSDEEFPYRRIPRTLRRRVLRGLTVEWISVNRRSFDKLLPALELFPDDRIVIADDDKLYAPHMVRNLVHESDQAPGEIVGHRGRTGQILDGNFRLIGRAGPDSSSGTFVLAGGNGTLYPPGALHPDVFEHELAETLCPTHDDVWFWAMAVRAGTRMRCLGTSNKPEALALQERTPALSAMNRGTENQQIDAVVNYFQLLPLIFGEHRTSLSEAPA